MASLFGINPFWDRFLFSHQQNLNTLLDAMNKKVETYVCQDTWWCASARYADIVLPATTALERVDITSGGTYSNDKVYAMQQVIEPYGESLDDFEIFRRLAKLFGGEQQYTTGKDMMGLIKEAYANSTAGKLKPFDQFWKDGVTHLPVPKSADYWQWDGITQSMFPRAGLNEQEKKEVLDFLYKHAAKA
ncbi:molybdopterin-dependent oxidoreductase [Photobacterium damselae]|uniref:molybdopterin-dependent oxidoreductase n=1 Tax=Photobacterium damselae TaxID=38293 RepID=UPI0022AA82B9|nr:molybdopterin-dependent oxidoreductase [Photobacterium damselae]